MNEKPFTTISQQITLLRERNLIFENEVIAAQRLSSDGYYEIINGYKDTFLDNVDHFKDGTKFEDIYALYYLDSRIRSTVLDSLGFFEQSLKQRLAYLLAEKYTEKFDSCINESIFSTGHKLKYPNKKKGLLNDRDVLFFKFKQVRDSEHEPFMNYRENHGNVPPWILFKGIDFGTLRSAIKLLNRDDKLLLAKRVFIEDIIQMHSDEQIIDLLSSILFLAHKFRNRSAHGGRIYNYSPEHSISYNKQLYSDSLISKTAVKNGTDKNNSIFVLYNLLSYTDTGFSFITLKLGLKRSLQSYSKHWEKQIPFILNSMSFPENYNWNSNY
ncbi:Abi family protein [Fructobacillus fructosus]|uniref:Abortive infection bacteriophage resistance protein (AbiF) n=1 Tax=Fructobacillus fructosus TaxID=1631 RepID=A0ABM9MZ77_9LACO|nr:Abortive infection bacteriophage resistance protein (AbiF) [Fructobacillus fructosus]